MSLKIKSRKSLPVLVIILSCVLFSTLNISYNDITGNTREYNPEYVEKFSEPEETSEKSINFNRFTNYYKSTISENRVFDIIIARTVYLGMAIISELVLFSQIITSKTAKREEDDDRDDNSVCSVKGVIFGFIKNYLDQNRYFEEEKILRHLNNRISKDDMNLNGRGAKAIINELKNNKMVIEGSKLTIDTVLSNQNRSEIYDYIKKNPGIYFNKLVNHLEMNIFSVKWHLDMLLKFNLIREQKIDNLNVYFVSELDDKKVEIYNLITRDKCQEILNFLKEHDEGITNYKIAKSLGMHTNTVKKYLNRMATHDLIEKLELSQKTLYFLNVECYNSLKLD